MAEFFSGFALTAAMIMVVVGGLAAILLPLVNAIGNPKSLVGIAIGLGFLLVVFGLGYGMASGEVSDAAQNAGLEEGGVKMVGASLMMMYILVIIAVVGIIADSILKFIR